MNEEGEFLEKKIQESIENPQNMGEMIDADAVGTVGSSECGDMVRMFLKFDEIEGKKIINKATFQSFGCQTAIAVASMATEMLKGKTIDEAKNLSADKMTAEIGSLPPMKLHCGEMVEGALRSALEENSNETLEAPNKDESTLSKSLVQAGTLSGKIKVIPITDTEGQKS
ncbi:MAG: iron-sulfur cluster assembly scaffold protein [Verrucomicrobiales bacterium]|nr:iron-sulfur cluster assembly scaffold protein [Verrucomicrobiales bacterium]